MQRLLHVCREVRGGERRVSSRLAVKYLTRALSGAAARAIGAAVNESRTIVLASHQACCLLEYFAGELHGQSVEVIIPDLDRLPLISGAPSGGWGAVRRCPRQPWRNRLQGPHSLAKGGCCVLLKSIFFQQLTCCFCPTW